LFIWIDAHIPKKFQITGKDLKTDQKTLGKDIAARLPLFADKNVAAPA
jgi:hypothetical protein